MLDGREPQSVDDWIRILNCVAANVALGMEESVCKVFKVMYGIPVDDNDVVAIAEFQRKRKT